MKLLKIRLENKDFNPIWKKKLLRMIKGRWFWKTGLIFIVSVADEEVELKKFEGMKDLVKGKEFDGRIEGYLVLVLK